MNFPKFMIRQTGGLAVGAISTRSRLASFAFWSATAMATIPSASPESPIRRTSFHRICSLTRILFLSIFHLRGKLRLPCLDCAARGREKILDHHRAGVPPVPEAHGDGSGRRLLLPDDEHTGDLVHLRLPDSGPELLAAVVRLDPQLAGREPPRDLPRRLAEPIGDREHDRLDRRDPEGEVARR